MKKLLLCFLLISSFSFSNTKDLKMKMVLNKEDVNQILIDIVPEDFEKARVELINKQKMEVVKEKPKTKIVKKKSIPKKIKKEIVNKEIKKIEESNKIAIKEIKPQVQIIEEKNKIENTKHRENKQEIVKTETSERKEKNNKIKYIIWTIIGMIFVVFNKIFRKK